MRWASACRIEPSGALAVLQCSPVAEPLGADSEESSEKTPVTMALFRDLDETIYMAACPFVEEDRGPNADAGESASKKLEAQDLRNCLHVEAGQTFSTEIENEMLRIVVRGRQLAFRIYRVDEKPATISTPYVPTPSRRPPDVGPATTRAPKGMEPQNEPRWEPPQLASASSGKPSQADSPGIEVAHTSLRTGRVTIQCASREAAVLIDGAYMGTCPLTTTLVAGPHTLTVRQPGQQEQVKEASVEAGKTLRWRVGDE